MVTPKRIKVLMSGQLPTNLELVKGGVEAVILNLFKGFSKIDSIDLIHVSFNKEVKQEKVIQYAENVRIIFLPYKIKIKLIDYFINRAVLKRIVGIERPDIIHIQEVTPHLLRFLFLPRQNIFVTQHGIMREEFKYTKGLREKIKYSFKMLVEKMIFPHYKNIIFISEYNRNLYRGSYKIGQTINNPVNPIFFESCSSLKLNNSMIYVGVINRRKNLKLVLESLAELKAKENIIYTLHVVGDYKESGYKKEILATLNRCRLGDKVIFHGWQTQEQVLRHYYECDIFVLPSQQETMPVSVGEAMSQGKVVIATDVGAISEMFTDKKSGFLFSKNSKIELCEILRRLYNNGALIKTTSGNARTEAFEKFHPDFVAQKTLEVYTKVIDKASNHS